VNFLTLNFIFPESMENIGETGYKKTASPFQVEAVSKQFEIYY